MLISIHINPHPLQLHPRLINLRHQLLMCLRNIVECEHAIAELEEEVCAEGNEGPEGKLVYVLVRLAMWL